MAERISNDASYEELVPELHVLQKIEYCRKDVREGKILSQEEAKEKRVLKLL